VAWLRAALELMPMTRPISSNAKVGAEAEVQDLALPDRQRVDGPPRRRPGHCPGSLRIAVRGPPGLRRASGAAAADARPSPAGRARGRPTRAGCRPPRRCAARGAAAGVFPAPRPGPRCRTDPGGGRSEHGLAVRGLEVGDDLLRGRRPLAHVESELRHGAQCRNCHGVVPVDFCIGTIDAELARDAQAAITAPG
jgi:hypothetical protein